MDLENCIGSIWKICITHMMSNKTPVNIFNALHLGFTLDFGVGRPPKQLPTDFFRVYYDSLARLTAILLVFPIAIIKRTNLSSLKPS